MSTITAAAAAQLCSVSLSANFSLSRSPGLTMIHSLISQLLLKLEQFSETAAAIQTRTKTTSQFQLSEAFLPVLLQFTL